MRVSHFRDIVLLLIGGMAVFSTTFSIGINRELNDQLVLNQKLMDISNKHEYYAATHHCTLQNMLQDMGKIPPGPLPPCTPNFIRHKGYWDPTMGERLKKDRPPLTNTPLKEENQAWSLQTSTPNICGM